MIEYYQDYIDNMYEEELQEELNNYEVENEEELLECYTGSYSNGLQFYQEMYSDKELIELIEKENLLDINKVIEYCQDIDGRGYIIASYDSMEEVEEVDVTALEELVLLAEDEYGTSNALGQYTVASFTAYEAAYTAAVAVISKADNNEALTQVEVDEAKAALETAIAGLVSVEVLKENLVEAKNVGEASEDWAEGYNKFMAPYFAAAEAALAKEDATQAEIDAADEELATAVGEAVEYADAYEEVLAAIVNAETTDTVGKTEESVAALQAAITAAYAALEAEATDTEALVAQIEALNAAVAGLEDEVVLPSYDKTALKAAIDAADAIFAALGEADLYDVYTEDSALAFETAYEEAKLTYEDDGTIIPLSQRFNKASDDIRKSLLFKLNAQ
jgi:hypothetical protein